MRSAPEIDSPHLLELDQLPGWPDDPIDWTAVYGRDEPLRIEVGVGNSAFLIDVAREEPDFNYLGFEYSGKRVNKFLKKVRASELEMIRMLRENADYVLRRSFAPGSVDTLFVNHPDPWPKRRHRKKRFVRFENNPVVERLLRPGGRYSLRTDDPVYARQMLEVLDSSERLVNQHGEGEFAPVSAFPFETPYEIKFKREGLRIHYLEYLRVEGEATDKTGPRREDAPER